MTEKPLVSILVGIYNSSKYLEDLYKNFSAQTFKNFEVLLVDDFSSDNSVEIIKQINQQDARFKLVKWDKKAGYGAKLYDLIDMGIVQGTYVIALTHDDYLDNDYLQKCYDEYVKTDADIILTNTVIVKENEKKVLGKKYLEKIKSNKINNKKIFELLLNWDIGGSALIKKDKFKQVGWNSKYYNSDELFIRKMFLYPFKVSYADTNFYYNNTNVDALTRKIKPFSFDILTTNIILIKMLIEYQFSKNLIIKILKKVIRGFGTYKRKFVQNYDNFNEDEKNYIKNLLINAREELYNIIKNQKYITAYFLMLSSDIRIKIRG